MGKKNTAVVADDTSSYETFWFIGKTHIPCDFKQTAYLPYWKKSKGVVDYGVDEYTIVGICGCGDNWICQAKGNDGRILIDLEPNVDIFFTMKDAERKISAFKKTTDLKKLAKWEKK